MTKTAPQHVTTWDGRRLSLSKAHPAPYSPAHILAFTQLLHVARAGLLRDGEDRMRVIDGMAGVGGIHRLDPAWFDTVANELEPAFVAVARQLYPDRRTYQGDARCLHRFRDGWAHAYITSPTFRNRLADHHRNQDTCKACQGAGCDTCWGYGVSLRRSYQHDAQRLAGPDYQLHPANAGTMGASRAGEYDGLHTRAWAEAGRLLRPGGLMVVDVKNHMRARVEVDIIGLHRGILDGLGFEHLTDVPIEAKSYRNGANRELRTKHHTLLVYRRPDGKMAS